MNEDNASTELSWVRMVISSNNMTIMIMMMMRMMKIMHTESWVEWGWWPPCNFRRRGVCSRHLKAKATNCSGKKDITYDDAYVASDEEQDARWWWRLELWRLIIEGLKPGPNCLFLEILGDKLKNRREKWLENSKTEGRKNGKKRKPREVFELLPFDRQDGGGWSEVNQLFSLEINWIIIARCQKIEL